MSLALQLPSDRGEPSAELGDSMIRNSQRCFVPRLTSWIALALSCALPAVASAQVSAVASEVHEEQSGRETLRNRFVREHSDESGRVRHDLWLQGMAHARRMAVAPSIGASQAEPPLPREANARGLLGSRWMQIGPGPIRDPGAGQISAAGGTLSGLVTDIAIDPSGTTDTILYVATDAGGLWKSIDGGASWQAKTDSMPAISMGAVALDPSNPSIVYAGSGSLFNLGDFNAAGVYKSNDGGDTWQVLNPSGVFSNVGINRIVLPDSGTVLVGAGSGLVRLTANGSQFTQPLSGAVSDLRLDTGRSSTVYAAVAGRGVFKSTDSGASFAATPFFSPGSAGLPAGLAFGGVVMAQSTRPNGNTFYASAILTAGQPLVVCGGPFGNPTVGLYKSTNGGKNWSEIKPGPELPAQLQTQGVAGQTLGYDQTLGVDPQNPKRFYFGMRGMYATNDGGANGLRDATNPGPFPCPSTTQNNRIDNGKGHADHHAITFSPASHFPRRFPGRPPSPTTVYLGNDGGLVSTINQGDSFNYLNGGLGTILMNALDIGRGSRANNKFSYGTAQDNGLFSHTPAQPGLEWVEGANSDGVAVAVDPVRADHAIGTDNTGFYTTSDGQNWVRSIALPNGAGPIRFDPNGSRVYAASGGTFFQSKDNGTSFSVIGSFAPGVTAIGQSPANSNTVWLGLGDGTVAFTNNALAGAPVTWVVPSGQPNGPIFQGVTGLAVDPTNTRWAVVVFPGVSKVDPANTPSRHVFMTTDAGATWLDISGSPGGGQSNLPDLPLYSVVIDPNTSPHTIIVAGDGGVFQSTDLGKAWQVLGSGLPNAQMMALALDSSVRPEVLRVASWGRSAFELVAPATVVTGNPSLIQSNWGRVGNFEMLAPQWNRVGQFFRDNDSAAFPWHSPRDFAYLARPNQLGTTPRSVAFIQSNFKGDGVHGNFEAIVRAAPPVATLPDHLDFWFFDSGTFRWNGPFAISADATPIDGVTGDPSFLQGNWGGRGNFELLVPHGNMIRQYFRNNDDPAFAWHFLREFGYPVRPQQLGPTPRSVTFIQSSFKGDGEHGNFEAIVRVAPPIATDPDRLDFFFLDSRTSRWNGPFPILVDGRPIEGVTGDPAFIQGNWGVNGNFELLVPQGDVIKQYFRNNDDPAFAWHFLREFGYPARPGQLGPTPRAVTFIQSNFKGDGVHGNFEAVVRVAPPFALDPDYLDFWFLDSKTSQWHGPFPLAAD